MKITRERLRELATYDPETGMFIALTSRGSIAAGHVIGVREAKGHLCANLDGRRYKLHHLAWFWVHGEWPAQILDHENRNPADNRIANLRLSTNAANGANRHINRNNTSGYRGVAWDRKSNCWRAHIRHHGKRIHLGLHQTPEAASAAFRAASALLRPLHVGEVARDH